MIEYTLHTHTDVLRSTEKQLQCKVVDEVKEIAKDKK